MASVRLCSHPPNPRFFCRGPARAWSAHQDDRPQGPHRRCVQEEGLDFFAYVATSDMLPQRAGSTVRAVYAFLRECLVRGWAHLEISPLLLSLFTTPTCIKYTTFSRSYRCLNSLSVLARERITHEWSRLGHSHAAQGVLNSGHVGTVCGRVSGRRCMRCCLIHLIY